MSIIYIRIVRLLVRFEDYVWVFKLIKDIEYGIEYWILFFVVMYDFGLYYNDGLKKKRKKGRCYNIYVFLVVCLLKIIYGMFIVWSINKW